jgi:hypothetical protein
MPDECSYLETGRLLLQDQRLLESSLSGFVYFTRTRFVDRTNLLRFRHGSVICSSLQKNSAGRWTGAEETTKQSGYSFLAA